MVIVYKDYCGKLRSEDSSGKGLLSFSLLAQGAEMLNKDLLEIQDLGRGWGEEEGIE